MEAVGAEIGGLTVVLVLFALFVLYYIYKSLEFVLVSVNLYRKMVHRQDAIVKLLLDIRDNTTTYTPSSVEEDETGDGTVGVEYAQSERLEETARHNEDTVLDFCYHCGAELPGKVDKCPQCGKNL